MEFPITFNSVCTASLDAFSSRFFPENLLLQLPFLLINRSLVEENGLNPVWIKYNRYLVFPRVNPAWLIERSVIDSLVKSSQIHQTQWNIFCLCFKTSLQARLAIINMFPLQFIFIQMFCKRTRFETEAQVTSVMAYRTQLDFWKFDYVRLTKLGIQNRFQQVSKLCAGKKWHFENNFVVQYSLSSAS